jgi:hypothetical protein
MNIVDSLNMSNKIVLIQSESENVAEIFLFRIALFTKHLQITFTCDTFYQKVICKNIYYYNIIIKDILLSIYILKKEYN